MCSNSRSLRIRHWPLLLPDGGGGSGSLSCAGVAADGADRMSGLILPLPYGGVMNQRRPRHYDPAAVTAAAREPAHTLGGGWSRRYDTHHASVSCAAAVGAGHHAGRRGGGGCRGAVALWPGPSSGTSRKAWGRTGGGGRGRRRSSRSKKRAGVWRRRRVGASEHRPGTVGLGTGPPPCCLPRPNTQPPAPCGPGVVCSGRSSVPGSQKPEGPVAGGASTAVCCD
ncbi:hypothetical protein PLESTM_000706200 [Pleodorina starrii]|nr:hypothetical protein PLESTM_000706200 [Pleodorina starrii]